MKTFCRKQGRRWAFEIWLGRFGVAISWKGLYVTADYFIDGARPLVRWSAGDRAADSAPK